MALMLTTGDSATIAVDQDAAESAEVSPSLFCRLLLKALEAAEGQTRRRKRDQAPDRLGLAIKRGLLERAAAAELTSDTFEPWLVEQIAESDAPGATRAMCELIFQEYRMARLQPRLSDWLSQGAPSDDAEPDASGQDHASHERGSRRRADRAEGEHRGRPDRWHGTDDTEYACTCHLPQR
jgi:hypothetical protein